MHAQAPPTTSAPPNLHQPTPLYRRPWTIGLVVLGVYGLLSLVAYWPILPGQSGRIPACACGDPALQTWFLRWVPYALAHGHNPFFSDWTNYPFGVNLAQNTGMPLLGLITAPLTILVSPIASYNLLLWLAFPLSAGSMFWVVRRWSGSTGAAFVAGLLYGFSAYTVGQGVGHVMLSFVPLPPLFFYQLHKLVIRRPGNPYREGMVLGAIAVGQFFIEAEVVATLVIMAMLILLVIVLTNYTAISRVTVFYSVRGLACCAAVVIVAVSYPLWVIEYGPQHFTGAVRPVNNPYRTDLLGPLIPTLSQHFAPSSLLKYGKKFGNVENGSYLGAPLLLLVAVLAVRFRKNRWILLSATMAGFAFVLSLGPRLNILGHHTSIPLPFDLIARFPLLDNLVPSRLSLYEVLFVSLVVSLSLAQMAKDAGRSFWAAVVGLGVLAAICLTPRWPYHTTPSAVPRFFTSSMVQRIPAASAVLTYPFPYYPENQAMMWQAVAGMRFKEVGTYALIRNAQGTATPLPAILSPAAVQEFLVDEEMGPRAHVAATPQINPTLVSDLRQYLGTYDVSTLIAEQSDTALPGTSDVMKLFVEAVGPPEMTGGVAVWFDIPTLLRARN